MVEKRLENFRVYDFTRMAGRYTHIYTCSLDIGRQLLGPLGMEVTEPAVYVFKAAVSDDEMDILAGSSVYVEEDVKNCSYGRQQMKHE